MVVCGVLPQGGIVRASFLFSLPGGAGPPLVQHRPRVTYSGTAKGPLLGGLPIVSGLEGVCEAWKEKERGAESCCLLLKRLERCEGTRKKSEAWGEGGTAAAPVVVVLLPSPALQGLGWAVNVEGAVRGGSNRKKGGGGSPAILSLLLLSLRKPRRAPLPECYGRMDARMGRVCVNGIGTRED